MKTILTIFIILLFGNPLYSQLVCPAKLNGKFGIIDIYGNWVIKPTFDSLSGFYNGFAHSYKNKKIGLIDHSGNIILKARYKDVGYVEDSMVDVLISKKIIFFNIPERKFIGRKYIDACEFHEGLTAVMNKKELWGFMNKAGEIVVPFQFEDVDIDYSNHYWIHNDSALVLKNNLKIWVDKNGANIGMATPEEKYNEPFYFIGQIGNLGVVNLNNDTILKNNYQQIEWFWYGRKTYFSFWYEISDSYGIADTTGKHLTAPTYDSIWRASSDLFAVEKDGKWGFLDNYGKIVIDFRFESVKEFWNNVSCVQLNGKWGAINKSGEWIINPTFDFLGNEFRDVFSVFEESH